MAILAKSSTTYKRDYDLGQDTTVKLPVTLPFALPDHRVDAMLGDLVDAIEEARIELLPTQTPLWPRQSEAPGGLSHGAHVARRLAHAGTHNEGDE